MVTSLITLLLYLLIVGIIIAVVYYVADAIPIPAPFNRLIKIVAMVIGALIVILLLLQLVGGIGSLPRLTPPN